MRCRKLSRVMGGSTGSTKEICETSGLPIPIVPRLHQCYAYMKRKLRAWRVQKCIAVVDADTVLVPGGKLSRAIGGNVRSTKEICDSLSLPILMVTRLHQCNGYIKRKLRAWKVQKCIALVGSDTVLTSAGSQTATCHVGQYRVH